MKNFTRLFIFVLAFAFAFNAYAEKRMILVEEATNASCGPCASQNPTFKVFLGNHRDRIIPVTYHSNYPGANDPMYTNDPTMNQGRYLTYYGINGYPGSRMNGDTSKNPTVTPSGKWYGGAPGDTLALYNLMNSISEESPISMTVTHTKSGSTYKIHIEVTSTEDVSSKKLRVIAVEYWHYYANAGNNGEKDFEWVARKMLPDLSGTAITLKANEKQTFDFTYTPKTDWNADQMYAVAFIQNDAAKPHDVLQAASSLKLIEPKLDVQDIVTKIPRNGEISRDVTITNESDVKATFNFSFDYTKYPIPNGWSSTVEPTSVLLDPGESKTVTLTAKSNDQAAFSTVVVVAKASPVTDYISVQAANGFFTLTEDAKYVQWTGYNPVDLFLWNSIAGNSKYNKDLVNIPYSLSQAYPPSDFDVSFFSTWQNNVPDQQGPGSFIPSNWVNDINSIVYAGKSAYIMSDISGWLGFDSPWTNQVTYLKNFYQSFLGIQTLSSQLTPRYSGQTLTPFTVTGFSDSVGKGVSAQANTGDPSSGNYDLYTDVFKLSSGSKAVPIFYYDNDKKNIAGVRLQKESGKVVFTSFGMEAFEDQAVANQIMGNIMDWLANKAPQKQGPHISSVSSLEFDSVEIHKTKSLTLEVKNDGDQDAVISSADINPDFNTDGAFTKTTETMPITLAPGGKHNFSITFAPKSAKEYSNVPLEIKYKDKDDQEVESDVYLNGVGANPSGIFDDNTSSNGLLSLSAAPNMFSTTTKITVNVNGSKNVQLTVIDAAGRTVGTIANEVMSGSTVKELSADGLASGTYYIIGVADGASVKIPVVINK